MVIMMFMSSSLGVADALLMSIIHFLVSHDRDVHNLFFGVVNALLVLIILFLASGDHDD
jgi:Flp pilus assembly protein protease CpaA